MKKIIYVTLTGFYALFLYIWNIVKTSVEASIAVNQVEDSIITYSLAQRFSDGSNFLYQLDTETK